MNRSVRPVITSFDTALCLVLLAAVLTACAPKVELPEAVRGAWRQADVESIRLRLEQNGDRGEVFLSTAQGADGSWFGPLPLKSAGAGAWKFSLPAEIVKVEGNNTTRTGRPQADRLGEMVIDQRGRRLVRTSVHLVKSDAPVELRLEGDRLTAEGLWVQVENQRWNDEGEPTEQKLSSLKVTLTRLPSVTPAELPAAVATAEPKETHAVHAATSPVTSDEPSQGLSNRTSDGFRITVTAATRVGRSWKGHVFFTYSAPEGSEIVVLKINIERAGEKDTFEAESAELLFADGSRSVSPVKSLRYEFPAKGSQDIEVPFIALPGDRLKTLLLGKLTFDLSALPVADKAPKPSS